MLKLVVMPQSTAKGERIRSFVLQNVDQHPRNIAQLTADRFDISRQATNKYLNALVENGILLVEDKGKSKIYRIKTVEWDKAFQIVPELAEDVVWDNEIVSLLKAVSDDAMHIWNHGFTEMFNNAIDHSEGKTITVYASISAATTEISLDDDGVGIFKKIQTELNLPDERQAALELAKGKFTTAPDKHSGEGIFFTSRMFDEFEILSNGIYLIHKCDEDDKWMIDRDKPFPGTTVRMKLENDTDRSIEAIFNQFSSGDNHEFNKTVVPVKLAQYGDSRLVSRSQAKRLLVRFDQFETIVLDFADVDSVGQAFADEIFRVFQKQHPNINLSFVNATKSVENMVRRAKARK